MLFIPSKTSRSRSPGRGGRDRDGRSGCDGFASDHHRPEQSRSSQLSRSSPDESFNMHIQRTPQYAAFMRVRVGRRLTLIVQIFNLFVFVRYF